MCWNVTGGDSDVLCPSPICLPQIRNIMRHLILNSSLSESCPLSIGNVLTCTQAHQRSPSFPLYQDIVVFKGNIHQYIRYIPALFASQACAGSSILLARFSPYPILKPKSNPTIKPAPKGRFSKRKLLRLVKKSSLKKALKS